MLELKVSNFPLLRKHGLLKMEELGEGEEE